MLTTRETLSAGLRIATRGSPLALAQAREVAARLASAHPLLPPAALVVVRTTGDRIQDRPLAEIGGKGLFTKEIDETLLEGAADLAVHSMKDVPAHTPDGLTFGAYLPREDVRDALLTGGRYAGLAGLPAGAVLGTSSPRRAAQALARRPDLRIVSIRGNVDTRLGKVAAGEVAATLLAVAGLNRLGRTDAIEAPLPTSEMLPAVAQGAIGVAVRADRPEVAALLAPLDDPATRAEIEAERALLAVLEGNCRTPIAALARAGTGGALALDGLVATLDGSRIVRVARAGSAAEAARLGSDAGAELAASGLVAG